MDVQGTRAGRHHDRRQTPAGDHHRQRVLCLTGAGQSGSALLETLLNELPDVVAVGASAGVWRRGVLDGGSCDCGYGFDSCVRWKAIGDRAFGGWDQVDAVRAAELATSAGRLRSLPAILRSAAAPGPQPRLLPDNDEYLTLIRPVLLAAGHRSPATGGAHQPEGDRDGAMIEGTVVVDSSPQPTMAAVLSLDPALDVRVVHLVRDPRGVANARPQDPVGSVVGGWLAADVAVGRLARRLPVLALRYEDLLAAPAHQLHRVATFAGVPSDRIDLRFVQGRTVRLQRPLHSLAGDPSSFGGTELTLATADPWPAELAGSRRRATTALTGPLLRRHGYEARPCVG